MKWWSILVTVIELVKASIHPVGVLCPFFAKNCINGLYVGVWLESMIELMSCMLTSFLPNCYNQSVYRSLMSTSVMGCPLSSMQRVTSLRFKSNDLK